MWSPRRRPPPPLARAPEGTHAPSPGPGALRGYSVVGDAAGGGGVWGTLEGGLHLGPSVPHSSPPALSISVLAPTSFDFFITFFQSIYASIFLYIYLSMDLSISIHLSTYTSSAIFQETDDKTIISVKLAKESSVLYVSLAFRCLFPLRLAAASGGDGGGDHDDLSLRLLPGD